MKIRHLSIGAKRYNGNLIKKSVTHVKNVLWESLMRGFMEELTKVVYKTYGHLGTYYKMDI